MTESYFGGSWIWEKFEISLIEVLKFKSTSRFYLVSIS